MTEAQDRRLELAEESEAAAEALLYGAAESFVRVREQYWIASFTSASGEQHDDYLPFAEQRTLLAAARAYASAARVVRQLGSRLGADLE